MGLALDILMYSVFVAFPFFAFCWVWFCKLSPQRLVMATLATIVINVVFGFALIPAFIKPAPGFQWSAFFTSCVPVVWAATLLVRQRNRDERVSAYLACAGVFWPVMVIDYAY